MAAMVAFENHMDFLTMVVNQLTCKDTLTAINAIYTASGERWSECPV
jgi:hypothetical protein